MVERTSDVSSLSEEDDSDAIFQQHVENFKLFRRNIRLFLEDTKAELRNILRGGGDRDAKERYLRQINGRLELLEDDMRQALQRHVNRNRAVCTHKIWTLEELILDRTEMQLVNATDDNDRFNLMARSELQQHSSIVDHQQHSWPALRQESAPPKSPKKWKTFDANCSRPAMMASPVHQPILHDVIFHIRTPSPPIEQRGEKIGSEYDADETEVRGRDDSPLSSDFGNDENFGLVELENGAWVPPFLAGIKPRWKKLCPCGIPEARVPVSWSRYMHEELDAGAGELNVPKWLLPDAVKPVNDRFAYNVLKFGEELYYNEYLVGVRRYACTELGISESGVRWFQRQVFVAVLMPSGTKAIGYLEVEPAQAGRHLAADGRLSESERSVEYGVSKIWVHVKYRRQHVATEMLDFFRDQYQLMKTEIAFASHDTYNAKFIQKYTGGSPVVIYTQSTAWNR
ncbi:uncharacterized protein LOC126846782 [Adelges cooleyi]|uniref:uncharacterized protein LOC126846782 n=1 Tax=Adelges cooleyi TaxID=133065 RepID=UPI00217F7A4D|nr:uncharacterized protein LOC126846782 [Adelges cooleyi]XP_050442533.1 uncharacterized protein LOC126846782 [Adelges cooleyi]